MKDQISAAALVTEEWEAEIRALEDQTVDAFLKADLETLDRLMADGYVVNSPLQRVVQKHELFELLRAGRIRHRSCQCEIECIRRHGEVVIVIGHDEVADPPDGVISRRRYTNIWQLQKGVWRTIARHAHVVPREAPGQPVK